MRFRALRPVQDGICLIALATSIFLIVENMSALPALVPVHFNFSGAPNRYAGRGVLWVIAAIGAGLCAILSVLQRFPGGYNLQVDRSDPRRPAFEQIAVDMLGWVKAEVVWLFTFLVWMTIRVAQHRSSSLGFLPIPLFLAVLAATIVASLLRGRALPSTPAADRSA